MRPRIGAKSDVGRVRDGNEDSYLVQEPLFVVADGMGGHVAGDVASRLAVKTIGESLPDGSAQPEQLAAAVKAANSEIWKKAHSDPELQGMGTTCTLLFVAEDEAHVAHVGDSRAYLLRDGELQQITEDHTLVGRMVREGRLRPEEAEHHPQRSIITRALGVDDSVEVDLSSFSVRRGDRVLLCSDGLTSMVDGTTIRDVLARHDDPQATVEQLIDLANKAGGDDNITAVVLSFDGGEGDAAPARNDTLTQEVSTAEVARRSEAVQPGAQPHDVTGTFDASAVRAIREPKKRRRRGRPVLTTVILVVLLLAGGAAIFKFGIVDNSYYVTSTEDGYIAIYRGLPDEVLGMEFQEEIERSSIRTADLPDFLAEDLGDAIEVESLDAARTTLQNLEERSRDEEFDRADGRDGKGNK